jgi:hypothetical protein
MQPVCDNQVKADEPGTENHYDVGHKRQDPGILHFFMGNGISKHGCDQYGKSGPHDRLKQAYAVACINLFSTEKVPVSVKRKLAYENLISPDIQYCRIGERVYYNNPKRNKAENRKRDDNQIYDKVKRSV